MKKSLQVLFVLGLCSYASAQQKNEARLLPTNFQKVNQSRPYPLFKGVGTEKPVPFSEAYNKNETVAATSYKTDWTFYTEQEIGQTWYDIQTNSSVKNHIVNNADGTIAAVWTTSHIGNPYDDRGTGYNYYNGNSWSFNSSNTQWDGRIEADRTGYTTVLNTNSGKEYVLAHNTNKSELHKSSRATKGSGTWISDTTLKSPHHSGATVYGNWWPMTALGGSDGETIHVISVTYPTAGQGSGAALAPYNGQIGAILYSRSIDGGATWNKVQDTLPLIGPQFYHGFYAEDYNIDASGNTVVIIAGGLTNDVVMLKSLDNGDTWTKTIIMQHPIFRYNNHTMKSDAYGPNKVGPPDGIADTLETNDGAMSALIDNTGLVHVWFGRQRMLGPGPDTVYNFPYTDGLYYWNEGQSAARIIASVKDMDGNDSIKYLPVDQGTWPFGLYQGQSLTAFPSSGVDASNNIYVGYSSIAEGTYNQRNKAYRHQFVMRSDDHGVTWNPSLDVTAMYKYDPINDPNATLPTVEGVFGSLARRVDVNVHLVYQRDDGPGTGVPVGADPAVDADDNTTKSSIVYVAVPPAKLINDVGIAETPKKISSTDVYPNPALDITNLMIKSTAAEKASISVTNMMGQQLDGFSCNLNVGTNMVKLDVGKYSTGIYFVKTTAGNSTVTTKLIVE